MVSRNREPGNLDSEIDRAFSELKDSSVGSQEYVKTLDVLTKLYHLKENEKTQMVSKDTLAIVGANLLGILMILRYENVGNFISSRALGFVLRTKT
jgi:hypothetical protein